MLSHNDSQNKSVYYGNLEVPFGKHKGKRVADVPLGYVKWACDNADLSWCPEIRDAFFHRVGRPVAAPKIVTVEDKIDAIVQAFTPSEDGIPVYEIGGGDDE